MEIEVLNTNILDGRKTSSDILEKVKITIELEKSKNTLLSNPCIAILLVGKNDASESYVKAKLKACKKAGINAELFRYSEYISTHAFLEEVKMFNKSKFDGFIVQLPLPPHIDKDVIINEISAYKDIDGFHPLNFGKMSIGLKSMRPATPYGILKLMQSYNIETKGKHVVVIGHSNIVGKPISIMLGNDFEIGRATVTSCDINTPKELLLNQLKTADIVITAVGKPNLITADMVKDGVIIIDVGINQLDNGKLVGDCDFNEIVKKAKWITPVPGGVGPMTIAGLILNAVDAWKMRNFIK